MCLCVFGVLMCIYVDAMWNDECTCWIKSIEWTQMDIHYVWQSGLLCSRVQVVKYHEVPCDSQWVDGWNSALKAERRSLLKFYVLRRAFFFLALNCSWRWNWVSINILTPHKSFTIHLFTIAFWGHTDFVRAYAFFSLFRRSFYSIFQWANYDKSWIFYENPLFRTYKYTTAQLKNRISCRNSGKYCNLVNYPSTLNWNELAKWSWSV